MFPVGAFHVLHIALPAWYRLGSRAFARQHMDTTAQTCESNTLKRRALNTEAGRGYSARHQSRPAWLIRRERRGTAVGNRSSIRTSPEHGKPPRTTDEVYIPIPILHGASHATHQRGHQECRAGCTDSLPSGEYSGMSVFVRLSEAVLSKKSRLSLSPKDPTKLDGGGLFEVAMYRGETAGLEANVHIYAHTKYV